MEFLTTLLDRDPEEWRPLFLLLGCFFFLVALITLFWWIISTESSSPISQTTTSDSEDREMDQWESRSESKENEGEWEFASGGSGEPAGEGVGSGADFPRIPTGAEIGARAQELAKWREENGVDGSQEDDWILAERELYMAACGLGPLPDRGSQYREGRDRPGIDGVSGEVAGELHRLGIHDAASLAEKSHSDRARIDQWFEARGIAAELDGIQQSKDPAPESRSLNTGSGRVIAEELDDIVSREFAGEDVEVREPFGIVYKSAPSEEDDLQEITGVGPVLEAKLHDFGVYKFRQIANWPDAAIEEFQEQLSFPDRIRRDNWVGQCEKFIAG